jgi:hypothetical protein
MNDNIIPIVEEIVEEIITNIETCNKNKIVSFSHLHDIFIIESIYDNEYYYDKPNLWWSKMDYFYFRILAKHEILNFIRNYKKNSNIELSVKDAMTMLYQQLTNIS